MLCNICHKNEATIHFKGIFNDQVFKINLCEECAKKKGVKFSPEVDLAELISTLTDLDLPPSVIKQKKAVSCSNCGMTYNEFKQKGRLGCANCYNTFSAYLLPLIERIHGSNKHIGKKPFSIKVAGKGKVNKISILKKELEQVVKLEEYEKAASLRDKIRALQKNHDS